MFHRFTSKLVYPLLAATLTLSACTPPLDTETRLQLALDNEQRGESVAALLELKNILQSDPDHLQTLMIIGRLSTEVGQSAEAVDYLTRARQLGATGPDITQPLGKALLAQGQFERLLAELHTRPSASGSSNAAIELLRGEALLGLGRLNEAEAAFRNAGKEQLTAATGMTGEARAAIIREQYERAEQLINSALEQDPFSVAAFRALGALRHKQERFEEAESAFVSAVEATTIRQTSDDLLLARIGLAESQWRMGEKGKALGNIKDLLDAYPWHPLPLYLRALFAYDSGEYRMATEYLREVRRAVPNHRPSQQLMAACEFELGHDNNVEQLLRTYLKDEPDDIEMRRLLARTHLRMGNPTGALATLLPVINQAPQDAGFLALLGRASLHSGDAALATNYLERATQNAPDDPDIRISLIVAQIGAGKTESAEKNLALLPENPEMLRAKSLLELVLLMRKAENERALLYAKQLRQSVPSNLHAMLALAELAETRGDPVRAIEWLEMARMRNPDSIEPRLLLVRYYSERDNHRKAHDIAVEAVQIRPHQADALIALAMQKIALGETQQAEATLQEALRASPESAAAYLALAGAAIQQENLESARNYLGRAMELNSLLLPKAVSMILEMDGSRRVEALSLVRHLQSVAENLPYGYTAAGDLQMAERRFGEALSSYQSALILSDDPVVALKSFIAAREAGMEEPSQYLQQWLALHPNNKSVRKMLDKAK